MNICDDKHEQIVYGGQYCPLCDLDFDLKQSEKNVKELMEVIEKLKMGDR